MQHGGLCPWPTFHVWVTMVRKKWLSPYYSYYGCYIYQTYTNRSSWHDLLMPHGGLCLWHTFHTWVTMGRKIWLSLHYSTYACYIHQTYTNCSSCHDLLMPHGNLCSWPTFHASVTNAKNRNSGAPVWFPSQRCLVFKALLWYVNWRHLFTGDIRGEWRKNPYSQITK